MVRFLLLTILLISAAAQRNASASTWPFPVLTDAFDGPASQYFGVNPDGSPKNRVSLYSSTTPFLIFDVGNNQVLCSASRSGLIQSACAIDDQGLFRGSSQWPFTINTGSGDVRLDSLPGVGCNLLGNHLPVYTFNTGGLKIRQLMFAPCSTDPVRVTPRAVIVSFRIDNPGTGTVNVTFNTPPGVVDIASATTSNTLAKPALTYPPRFPEQSAAKGKFAAGYEAIRCLDDTAWNPSAPAITFPLAAGASKVLSFAVLTGQSLAELQAASCQIAGKTTLEWLNQTLGSYAARLGSLSIPDDPFQAELFQRLADEAYHSVMGSGTYTKVNDDGAHLLMAMIDPVTLRNYAAGAGSPPISSSSSHSVYISFLGTPVACAEYYQTTGDTSFFSSRTGLYTGVKAGVTDLFSYSKRTPRMLFFAQNIWDSMARGDWHTGSNIFLWYAFKNWARIARSAHGDNAAAAKFDSCADRLHADLHTYMVNSGPLGQQYFEGVYIKPNPSYGFFLPGHDGEEGASSMAPFYGFCRADDPKLLNYKKRALCPDNPIYNANLDAINWHAGTNRELPWSGEQTGPTSPSWITGLAGASTEGEVERWVRRIGQITDLDGSIWWWPYKISNKGNPSDVKRTDADYPVGKVGYTASMYGSAFYFKILGLTFDYPARSIRFAPLCPWNDVAWDRCRMGNSIFDIRFHRQAGSITAEITNNNVEGFRASIELPVPFDAMVTSCTLNGVPGASALSTLYGRPSYSVSGMLVHGETRTFTVNYNEAKELLGNPDFEAATGAWVSLGNSTVSGNALKAHTGTNCAAVTGHGGFVQSVTTGFAPGQAFALSGFAKWSAQNSGSVGGYIGVKCFGVANTKLSETRLTFTNELCFTRKSAGFTIPAGTSRLEVYVFRDAGGTATFSADDISLRPAASGPANKCKRPAGLSFHTLPLTQLCEAAGPGIQIIRLSGQAPETTSQSKF